MARAQSIWLEPTGRKEVNLEILKPAFSSDGFLDLDYTTFTLAYYLSGRFPMGETSRLVCELPFAHAAVEDRDFSDTCIGDLYLGAEFGRVEGGLQGDFGIRLPTAPEDNLAAIVGGFADYVDRIEAFLPDVLSVTASCNYKYRSAGGLGFSARLAPVVWIMTGDSSDGDEELFFLYNMMAWYGDEDGAIGGGFSGRFLATDEDAELEELTNYQLGLFGNLKFGRWMPGIQLRIPMDEDLKEILATEVSLSLSVELD